MPKISTLEEQILYFEDNTIPEPNTGCLFWVGYQAPATLGTYPSCPELGGTISRWVVQNMNCQDVTGMHACHTCDVKPCVAPGHLYAGTWGQNYQDSVDRGQMEFGRQVMSRNLRALSSDQMDLRMAPIRKKRAEAWASLTEDQKAGRIQLMQDGRSNWLERHDDTEHREKLKSAHQRRRESMSPDEYRAWVEARNAKIRLGRQRYLQKLKKE